MGTHAENVVCPRESCKSPAAIHLYGRDPMQNTIICEKCNLEARMVATNSETGRKILGIRAF